MGRNKENFVVAMNEDGTDKIHRSPLKPKLVQWSMREKKRKSEKAKAKHYVPFFSLFRYSSPAEKSFIFIGSVCSIFAAVGLPLVIVFYGEYTTLLIERKIGNNTFSPTSIIQWFGGGRTDLDGTEEDLRAAIKEDAVAFGVGCGVAAVFQFIFCFLSILVLNYVSLKQSAKVRRLFLKSVLRQEVSWFDLSNANNFASRMTEDLDKIQEGTGEKIGLFIFLLLSFLTSIVLAFFKGWKLTLVTFVCAPIIIICNGIVSKMQSTLTAKELESYGKAGSVAEEVFSSIKTVMSFGGENKEIERYKSELESSREAGLRRGRLSGAGSGIMWFIIYCCHSLCFWYGVLLILESREANNTEYTPSVLIIVFFGVLAGAMNMGLATPHLEAFSVAKAAAVSIFSVIERTPAIDSLSPKGEILPDIKGEIRFQNVTFSYPARPEIKVLEGIDLTIKAGEMVALVGTSGSGKSTVVQMMQRLYDPSEGSVFLDGRDMKDLNVRWLRQQLGVVGQEPSLFGTTIYENIKFGLHSATKEDVENAAKLANAHDFIMKFPKKYDTLLGEKGTELSGGQKQRIAIARALIRNPKILILDEATSALDVANERAVQTALEKASKGRTTVVVTHKLSNIKNADRIVLLSEGRIVEEGTHEELIALRSHYFKLVEMQFSEDIDIFSSSAETESEAAGAQTQRSTSLVRGELVAGNSVKFVPDKNVEECGREATAPASLLKILKYNRPEWLYLLVGSISTLLVGGSLPAMAVVFGELYGILSEVDVDYVMGTTSFYSGLFLLLGIVAGLATFLQTYTFNYAGVALTSRMRIMAFSSILRQDAEWFDDEKHGVGVLCTRLSGDASSIQGATGSRFSIILQSVSTLLIGALLAFFYSWKMTLVTLVTVPVVFFGVYLEAKLIQSQSLLEKNAIEKATKMAMEAISNIRTVAAFGREQTLLDLYDKELLSGERKMHLKSVMRGVAFALGQTTPYLCYGISLWYGGILVADEGLHYKNLIKVSEVLLYGAWTLGQSLAFAPNFMQAKMSAGRIFEILDRKPKTCDGSITKDPNWRTKGSISMSQVKFSYPTRPEVEVLKGFNLNVEKGQSIALVGPSGCGKSTVVQILQRIYDPLHGNVKLDESEISDLEVCALRRQYGVVSQEPVLFDRTIAENIAYGDNSRQVTHVEIVAAAKSANIHDFISCLPAGYHTRLGTGGAQLSGGQKQRIAIARALVRNPTILLLDEATSALDATSESLVQAALDGASEGRTTITISHRPGAVLKADAIYFLDQGQIIESGKHEELLKARGRYAATLQ